MTDLSPAAYRPRGPFNPLTLEGRTILVTGASSGIGRASAVYLSRLGARIIASGRDAERLTETLDQLEGEGHVGRTCDLSQLDGIVPWMKALCADHGPLDGLAHCAGIQSMRPLQAVNLGYVHDVINANLNAALVLAQAFRLKACHSAGASLVFVASTAGIKAAPGNTVYSASKGGLIAATKSLGLELLRDGIRVNAVAPALVDTPIAQNYRAITEDGYQKLVDLQPLGIGHPDDVAAAIAFLMADTSRWITGTILNVDGGFLA